MKIINNKEEAIKYLINNNIVVLPTDTVYGIMAIANKDNEKRINILKQSPINKKISIIFSNVDYLINNIDNLNKQKKEVILNKLPGKYTFIVNLKEEFYKKRGFDREDFGVRVTANNLLQSIIKETGPLLASSCNKTGNDICISLEDIKKEFNDENIVLLYDGTYNNSSSTIVDLTNQNMNTIRP